MSRGRKPNYLHNDIQEDICDAWFGRDDPDTWPLWIDDIVSGVARLDWYGDRQKQIPLSTTSIIRCFLCLDEISTQTVADLLGVQKRQAERYSKACRLCYPYLKRSLEDISIRTMKYPRSSIVCESHGVAMGYDPNHKRFN